MKARVRVVAPQHEAPRSTLLDAPSKSNALLWWWLCCCWSLEPAKEEDATSSSGATSTRVSSGIPSELNTAAVIGAGELSGPSGVIAARCSSGATTNNSSPPCKSGGPVAAPAKVTTPPPQPRGSPRNADPPAEGTAGRTNEAVGVAGSHQQRKANANAVLEMACAGGEAIREQSSGGHEGVGVGTGVHDPEGAHGQAQVSPSPSIESPAAPPSPLEIAIGEKLKAAQREFERDAARLEARRCLSQFQEMSSEQPAPAGAAPTNAQRPKVPTSAKLPTKVASSGKRRIEAQMALIAAEAKALGVSESVTATYAGSKLSLGPGGRSDHGR